MGLTSQLKLARLQLITDIRARQGDWAQFVKAVFDGGVDLLQVRDANASRHDLLAALEVARAIAFDHRKAIVVGQNAAVAAKFGADFLHLGAADGPTAANREGLPAASLVGRSVHSERQIGEALADDGISYLFVGPVYDTRPDDAYDAPGLGLVRLAAEKAPVTDREAKPWFAVGGITLDNLDDVLAAGAVRVGVAGAISQASDPEQAAEKFAARLKQAWNAIPAMEQYRLSAFGAPGTATFNAQAH